MSKLSEILKQNRAKYPIGHRRKVESETDIPVSFDRITTEGIFSPREKMIRILGGLRTETGGVNQKFEKVSEADLMNLDVNDLVFKMVKSDSLIDLTVNLYCTLVSLEHEVTSESDVGDRAIREINEMLEMKKIPLSLLVSHICSSMILRGNVCVERVFDDKMMPSSVFAVDPRWFRWQLKDKGTGDGQMWYLGQNVGDDAGDPWSEIDSPNVLWLSINPLVGERMGRSPLQTAFSPLIGDTQLLDAMTKVIQTQAFVRRYIQFKVLKAKELNYSDTQIDQMVKDAKKDMTAWANLDHDDIPTSTDVIDWNSEGGATGIGGFNFAETADRMYDRKSFRGVKLPGFMTGSNENQAETSAATEAKFYSVQLGSGQGHLKFVLEWVYRGFLRSMGIRADPVVTTKRINAVERLEEALAFEAILKGVLIATQAGMSLPSALMFYEQESGSTLSGDLKAAVQVEWEERKEMMAQQNEEDTV